MTGETPDSFATLIASAAERFVSAPREAEALASEALSLVDDHDAARRAEALWARGLARTHGEQPLRALEDLHAARSLLPDTEALLPLRCRIERGLALSHEFVGTFEVAFEHVSLAHALALRIGDPLEAANCRLSIGVVLSRWERTEEGLRVYREVEAEYRQLGVPERRIPVLNNIGINLKNLGRFDEACAAFDEALAICASRSAGVQAAILVSNRSEALIGLGRHDEAIAALEAAGQTLVAAHHGSGRLQVLNARGRALHLSGRFDEALAVFEQLVELAGSLGARVQKARAHESMAGTLQALGRADEALTHYMRFHESERTLFNEASDRKIAGLQVRFELERVRRTAEAAQQRSLELARSHQELQTMHEALVASDRDKTLLLLQLAEQSRTDALTGLANRRHLDERLADEFMRARRYGHPLSIAMCDIDFFKRINDRLGHPTGDEVLRKLAALLQAQCRETDFVARYGGEEFCIVFIETAADDALRVCEAVRHAVEAFDWKHIHPELSVTLSIGVANLIASGGHEQLLAAADAQLYQAKYNGKNQVRFAASA
jgi:diguanylate cyclase (GGDEF)-like protein